MHKNLLQNLILDNVLINQNIDSLMLYMHLTKNDNLNV